MLVRLNGHARSNAVAYIALFVALGGTTYAAAGRIDGRLLKSSSVSGKALRKNTLGGREINEAKLGAVPRALAADSAKRADAATRADSAASADTAARATSAGRADSAASADSAADAAKLGGLTPSAFVPADRIVLGSAQYEPDDTARSVLLVPGFFELFTTADNDTQFDLSIASRSGGQIEFLGAGGTNNTSTSSTTPTDPFNVLVAPGTGRILNFTVHDSTRQAQVACGFGTNATVYCSALVR
jgi:hypothetical protein